MLLLHVHARNSTKRAFYQLRSLQKSELISPRRCSVCASCVPNAPRASCTQLETHRNKLKPIKYAHALTRYPLVRMRHKEACSRTKPLQDGTTALCEDLCPHSPLGPEFVRDSWQAERSETPATRKTATFVQDRRTSLPESTIVSHVIKTRAGRADPFNSWRRQRASADSWSESSLCLPFGSEGCSSRGKEVEDEASSPFVFLVSYLLPSTELRARPCNLHRRVGEERMRWLLLMPKTDRMQSS